MKSFLREVLITVALALVIFFGARATLQTFVVIMSSMEPSFYQGQRLVVNKALYLFSPPERGDVIIFESPTGRHEDFIKRVIGLPGDKVEIIKGVVYIDDVALDEPYIKRSASYTMAAEEVPPDRYFVLGDNRDNSNDSHNGWFAEGDKIIGKAWLSTWPPDAWGLVPDYHLGEQLASAESE